MNQHQLHIDPNLLAKEAQFTMSCSSGNGGQNVNRVATKATLHFSIEDSKLLTEAQKSILKDALKNRISKEGFLIIVNQESRSAVQNKKAALQNLMNILQKNLISVKPRKKLKTPKRVHEKRLAYKKRNAEKKDRRKPITQHLLR